MENLNKPLTINSVAQLLANGENPSIRHFQEARWLLEHVLEKSIPSIAFEQINLSDEQSKKLNTLILERVKNQKPLGYLLGKVPFCDLWLEICPPILIPRLETEEWCSHLIEKLQQAKALKPKIWDLCSGSGCIAIALAKAFPSASVIGSDVNPSAVELAQRNAHQQALSNIKFCVSDLFSNFESETKFDLIVSNPPYISKDEWNGLCPQVKDWEDKAALLAGNDGLEFYQKIISQAGKWLDPNGLNWLVLEIGHNQAEEVKKLLEENNFQVQEVFIDSFGNPRAIFSKRL